MDEPFFLAIARQALRDPLHPLSFAFNWYGWSQLMAAINNTPPVLGWLMAGALRLTGGGEFWTRALFLPFDLASALALLALAARFLKKPLWPVLIILAGPAWALNLNHLMAERVMAAFALPSLWLAVAAADDGDARAFWASAVLAALALLTKYNALFVLPPALYYAYSKGASPRRLAAWAVVGLSGVALSHAWSRAAGADAVAAAWGAVAGSARMSWSAPAQRLRALLAFTGGLALPWIYFSRPSRRAALAAAAACAALYAPWLDAGPSVRPVDRLAGFVFAWGACAAAWSLARGARGPGRTLWAPWAASVAALQLVYWAVMARFVVFLLPPLLFAAWERLEADPVAARRLGRAGFSGALFLGAAAAFVDRSYASAQRLAVKEAFARVRPGGTVWFGGHWGLQEYMLAAGARQLDAERGGWDAVKPGDLVVDTWVNTNRLKPARPRLANAVRLEVPCAVPLRLLGDGSDEAGFYSSGMGFLPWSFSTAPVDVVTFVEPL